MPRQNNATESDLDFHRRLTEFSLWHRNVLLWHLKDSWRQRTKITRLTNALSKALRRK